MGVHKRGMQNVMAKLTQFDRHKIVILHQQGKSQRAIARLTGFSRCGVQEVLKKFEETGEVKDRKRSGRPKKLSESDEKYLKVTSLRDRRKSSKALAHELAVSGGTKVHSSTIRRSLGRSGLHGRVATKKPLLRRGNKQKRLKFAKRHKTWNSAQWRRVLWSDESQFQLFGSNRRHYVRRRVGEKYIDACLQPTVKHGGGSVMVWGCISANGVGDLIKIDGIMKAPKYKQILIHHAIPSGKRLIGNNFIFQHDNDPKHSAKIIKSYLQRKSATGTLTTLDWPPQSPDLNIIEAVWDYLDREKNKKQPTSKDQLWRVLKEAWDNIPEDYLQKLQQSLPKRIAAVIKSKGGHTKY